MANLPVKFNIMDWVNIALAVFSWLLPDVPLLVKLIITIMLIGMLVVARKESFTLIKPPDYRYVLLALLVIFMGVVETGVVYIAVDWQLGDGRTSLEGWVTSSEIIQTGFTYGVFYGLPIG